MLAATKWVKSGEPVMFYEPKEGEFVLRVGNPCDDVVLFLDREMTKKILLHITRGLLEGVK